MRRKAPLRRKTPLRRAPWRKKGKAKHVNSYRKRERHVDYMLWVKTLPCIVTTMGAPFQGKYVDTITLTTELSLKMHVLCCNGDVEADHLGLRAMRRKAHDSTVGPLCTNHHDQRTNGWGLFANLTLVEKRAWKQAAIEHTQARAREQGVEVPACST